MKDTINDEVPPMTNMDPSYNIPGSITPEERSKRDYAAVAGKDLDDVEAPTPKKRGPQKPKTLPKLNDPSISEPNPMMDQEPIRKGSDEIIDPNDLNVDIPEAPSKPTNAAPKMTDVEPPKEFEENFSSNDSEDKLEEPLPNLRTDHVGETPLEDEVDVEPSTSKSEATLPNANTSKSSIPQTVNDASHTFGNAEVTPPSEVDISDDANKKKVSDTEKLSDEEEEELKKNVEGSFPETALVEGITSETAEEEELKRRESLNKTVPVRHSPKVLSSDELTEIVEYTTRHYRIFEGQKTALRKPIDLSDQSKIQIVDYKEDSNFDIEKLRIDQAAKQGVRKVQVVCTQSGYSVCCLPMNSREIQSFDRDDRSKVENSYGQGMAIAQSVYRKLTDFSCGAVSFEKFLDITAFPDLQTLVYGIYMATYPGYNNFNLSCTYTACQKEFSIPIKSDTLIQLPPGNVTQEQIQEVLFSGKNPADLIKASKRYTGIRIFVENKTKMFIVRTPSIGEFYERAYRNKQQRIIDAYNDDSYMSGYIRSVGTLDIMKYNETGEIVYYQDDRIETIDKAIADLSADDKEIFSRRILDYINRYSVAYQIPRVRCPHCRRIMSQREVNTLSLFFVARAQRGLY